MGSRVVNGEAGWLLISQNAARVDGDTVAAVRFDSRLMVVPETDQIIVARAGQRIAV